MKRENPSFKIIKSRLYKLVALFLISVAINSGCKLSYNDISLGSPAETAGGIDGFPQDNYGYVIYDIDAAKIVKGHNINKEFTPASVTKLFTSLFADEILGDNYTFSTKLSYHGSISDNILTGDLYLKGYGDPELSISELQKIANSLKAEKIKDIKGNFYFDESYFTPRDMLDKDMPVESYYNAGISPLTFNSSIIYALQRKNSDGRIKSADLIPSLPSFDTYIYKEDLPYPFLKFRYIEDKEIWGLPDKNLWDSRQQLPVKHPGLFTAEALKNLCAIRGIKLPSPKSGTTAPSSIIISEIKSRPLTAIIKNMLFTSNNMTAELIYAVSSDSYIKKEKPVNNSSNAIENFFRTGFTGIGWNNFRIANGSGLTSLNRVTPAQTSAVLLFIEKTNKDKFKLEEILPLSGWDGTMRSRLDQPEGVFRVYGKTGSIFYASGLAGVFYGSSGKRYIFTVYINDNAGRSEYEKKIEKTAADLNQAGIWTKKAASEIDKFILKMIAEL